MHFQFKCISIRFFLETSHYRFDNAMSRETTMKTDEQQLDGRGSFIVIDLLIKITNISFTN